jgi:cation-transporting ATPase E
LFSFFFPAAILTSAIGVTLFVSVYLIRALETPGAFYSRSLFLLPSAEPVAQTSLTYFIVSCGLFLVIFVEPPTRWWVGGSQLSGDWRPTLLAVGLLAAMLICSFTPPLRAIFALSPLGLREYAMLAVALIVWLFMLRFTWRFHLLDRFLAVSDGVVPGRSE